MAEGRSAAELGAFGVTPAMPADAVLELLREYREMSREEGLGDPLGAYIAELAPSVYRSPKGALAALAAEKRLATARNGRG